MKKPWVVMSTGQSNSEGQATGGTDTSTDNIKTWYSGDNSWHSGYNNPPWSLQGGVGSKLALGFSQYLYDLTGRNVYIISHAIGGQPISQWMGVNSPMYLPLTNRITAAMTDLSIEESECVDAVLWHQGEADALNGNYQTDIKIVQDQFMAEPFMSKQAIFCVGELARGGTTEAGTPTDTQSKVLEDFEAGVGYKTCFAQSGGLSLMDSVHFDADGLWELGKRYAKAFLARRYLNKMPSKMISGVTSVIPPGGITTVTLPFESINLDYKPQLSYQKATNGDGVHNVSYSSRTCNAFNVHNDSATASLVVRWTIHDCVSESDITENLCCI